MTQLELLPQSVPSLLVLWVQPATGSHASSVHALLSSQLMAVPLHAPFAHLSLLVQPLPSLQVTEFAVNVQPTALSQLSVVQALPSVQVLDAVPPLHFFLLHFLPVKQTSPSSHAMPSPAGAWVHVSSLLLYASVVHGFLSSHLSVTMQVGSPGMSTPLLSFLYPQTPLNCPPLPHDAVLPLKVNLQVPLLPSSSVHSFLSSQTRSMPQLPLLQTAT